MAPHKAWIQFQALVWKNWIISLKNPILTFCRNFLAPVIFAVFLSYAQVFPYRLSTYGLGQPARLYTLEEKFDPSLALLWSDDTDGSTSPSPQQIMDHVTASLSTSQIQSVRKVSRAAEIPSQCPQNFKQYSQCFAGISFCNPPASDLASQTSLNYTLFVDGGLTYINVEKHTSDPEERILPLQWAIDRAIVELQTGVQLPTPSSWPFTRRSNSDQTTEIRLSFIHSIRDILSLAFSVAFVGITYQLPGAVAGEKAALITAHLKAMGLLDRARILSWHFSVSLAHLPAWLAVGVIWSLRVFTESNPALIILVHVLFGLALASWSLFVAAPFGKSPQMAAVVTTFLAVIISVIAVVLGTVGDIPAFFFTIAFPPAFYVFTIRAICGWESHLSPANVLKGDPDEGLTVLPQLVAAIIDIFLWPCIAVLWERYLYDAKLPSSRPWYMFWKSGRGTGAASSQIPADNVAISVRHLNKVFRTSRWSSRGEVTAVEDLSFDVPKTGIFVLLGSNGAGKSTSLSIIAGLDAQTGGEVLFEGGLRRPVPGTMGIVPQKNVLFGELSCLQNLKVWQAVKSSPESDPNEDLVQLLEACDLGKKIHAEAGTLSGGQKRKLQLAIGLVAGSKTVLVDECTSGVDPVSRRALWKVLTSFRGDRAFVFTTHFLDEADLLADHIAILAAPGKLIASGSPVALKRDLGEGYSIQVTFNSEDGEKIETLAYSELLDNIRIRAPQVYTSSPSPCQVTYHLKSKEPTVVQHVLEFLEREAQTFSISSYDILGTTIEDIFLGLMAKHGQPTPAADEEHIQPTSEGALDTTPVALTASRAISPLRQALAIFHKRMLIARRSWLIPLLTVLVALAGACIPLIFVNGPSVISSCTRPLRPVQPIDLFLPTSPLLPTDSDNATLLVSPPGVLGTVNTSIASLNAWDVPDQTTFIDDVQRDHKMLSLGGLSLNTETNEVLFAWEAEAPGRVSGAMLNLASNVLYNRALNGTGKEPGVIGASYSPFPGRAADTLSAVRWIVFFGALMSIYPSFYALYVAGERKSGVQAMQMSNGLSNPIGLWLGHLMFDSITVVIISTLVTIIFAAAASSSFAGLGFLWLIMVLYGIAAALFAYCVTRTVKSPLAAFAIVAIYQFHVFVLYLSSYMLVYTYSKPSETSKIVAIIHWITSALSPIGSLTRAALISTNIFSLLCDEGEAVTARSMGSMVRYSGPIVYLLATIVELFVLLVWVDSGFLTSRRFKTIARRVKEKNPERNNEDVIAAAEEASYSDDLLKVLGVSKTYGSHTVVDDVSFSLPRNTVMALLGPNGAGKTTTFNMIRGDVTPDMGDVLIDGASVIRHPKAARASLGVCPQFSPIDSHLTVREHLIIYGKLKGLTPGRELEDNVNSIMRNTTLVPYADRLASKLSGGNQRKLSLAIALMGNPSVILIDEFSSGVDPKAKRDMWVTLRKVSAGKAVVITTHSMEEASALADKVGILAKRLLAVGTLDSLSARYAAYEVHFTCRSPEESARAQRVMLTIPGAKMADDVATRFEVPVGAPGGGGLSLAKLFRALSSQDGLTEFTVEKVTLEGVFLKVIRENDVEEEGAGESAVKRRFGC